MLYYLDGEYFKELEILKICYQIVLIVIYFFQLDLNSDIFNSIEVETLLIYIIFSTISIKIFIS